MNDPAQSSESDPTGRGTPTLLSWSEVVGNLPDGVILVDGKGVHLDVNEAFCRLVGSSRTKLIGIGPPFPYVGQESQETCEVTLARAMRGEASSAELSFVDAAGRSLTVSFRATPAPTSPGGLGSAVVLVNDITAQKQLEASLRDSERRWRSIVDNPNDFVVILDRNYRYLFVNHTEPGITEEELIGKATPMDSVEPHFHAEMKAAFDKTFDEGVVTTFEAYSAITEQWLLGIVGPIIEDGKVTSVSLMSRDITAKKTAELALGRAQKLEMLGVLASGIAHDFKNLLNPIAANLELLRESVDRGSPEYVRIREASLATDRARNLMDRFVLFGRSAQEMNDSLDLTALVTRTFEKSSQTLPAGIVVTMELSDDCPRVAGVEWQVRQALENLLDNARRALSATGGPITVSVTAVSVDAIAAERLGIRPGKSVKLSVHDDGPGMTREAQERAFEPFFTTWQMQGCSGLGLPMVQAIMARHQGAVVARGGPAGGTTVDLYFPGEGANRGSGAPRQSIRKRILCVDDEAPVLKLTRRVLERGGHFVVTMTSPVEALRRLRENAGEFDLVITDYTMPELTGAEFAGDVLTFAPGLPFLLVSGFCDPLITLPPNIRASLQKPVPVETLLGSVERATAQEKPG